MAAIIPCHYCSSLSVSKRPRSHIPWGNISHVNAAWWGRQLSLKCSLKSSQKAQLHNKLDEKLFPLKGMCNLYSFGGWIVLISGPPIKDPGALLRYALPIDNKAIREVQKPLEDITDSLKVAGVKALDSVERNVRQASRALEQGKSLIISGLAESKKDHGMELLDKLQTGNG
ncbi:PEPTIDYL-PROLYL CIS-TRANS ISOMERASE CYP38 CHLOROPLASTIC [Salix purpurea]|uniref:peptidylprolyl isomerase n=1 Tax=Salix purpurea TaxID=77065 RepID=A0A9Q0URL9_SALPP|nr:PEPTIDYL-PROLYL CIS-TRANS ISOMERASE CYP38 CHLOROPLASTIC [Salix purpurea]